MRVLTEPQIRAVAGYDALVEAVGQSFAALASGAAQLPAVMTFEFPDVAGEAHVKGAHLLGARYYVVKVASGFYSNPGKGLPVGAELVKQESRPSRADGQRDERRTADGALHGGHGGGCGPGRGPGDHRHSQPDAGCAGRVAVAGCAPERGRRGHAREA
jgi:hypothetical protein